MIDGLPAHVLFVHAVVVLVPLAALALVVCAAWPSAARRLGLALPLLALVALAFVPVTTHAGEWLEGHVREGELVERHTSLGDGVLPWAIGLAVVAVGVWWLGRGRSADSQGADSAGRPAASRARLAAVPVRIVAVVLALVVGAGSVVAVYRAGDSGATAAWHDKYSKSSLHHGEGGEDGDGD